MSNSEFLSVSEYAEKYGKDPGWVRRMLADGRIPGTKIGKQWIIPAGAPVPADRRVKSGKYRDWRKPKNETE